MTDNAGERDIFKDHVATYKKHDDFLETLEWKKPKSSNYAIWFVRQYGTLMVWGDCFEATYQWNWEEEFDLAWVAKCDEHYFISKCRASPHGRKPYTWSSSAAEKKLKEYFNEFKDEEQHDEREGRAEEEEKFKETGGWDYLDDLFSYHRWAYDNAYDVFGESWQDSSALSNPGEELDFSVSLHLKGLKAAFKYLKKSKK